MASSRLPFCPRRSSDPAPPLHGAVALDTHNAGATIQVRALNDFRGHDFSLGHPCFARSGHPGHTCSRGAREFFLRVFPLPLVQFRLSRSTGIFEKCCPKLNIQTVSILCKVQDPSMLRAKNFFCDIGGHRPDTRVSPVRDTPPHQCFARDARKSFSERTCMIR